MFRKRIQAKYEEFTPRFRGLADFILENTLDVGFLTATELARRINVDPATVVRFSQEVGYSGYREMSREIKQYVNQELALRYQKGAPEATGLAGQIALFADELSDRILSLKAEAQHIAEVAEQLHQAARVFVIGQGVDYEAASLWATYLNIIGVQAHAVRADTSPTALMLRDATPEDVVVVLSLGLSPNMECGQLLSTAQGQGLKTIAVTANHTLPPARRADLSLTVPAKTPSGYPSFDTLMALLALLWQALVALDEDKSQEKVKEMAAQLNTLTQQCSEAPPYDIAAFLRFWNQE